MKKSIPLLILLISFMSFGTLFSNPSMDTEYWTRQAELNIALLNAQPSQSTALNTAPELNKKKPGIGILMSAAVPGTGEFYAGSWLKGALFLTAEIGLWVAYDNYNKDGEKWEGIFQDYADTYWNEGIYWEDVAQYDDNLKDVVNQDNYTDYLNELRAVEKTLPHHTHGLPHTKTQQYYEMIGKYNQFSMGWTDSNYDDNGRFHYETMRDKSNQFYIKGSNCAMVILANHLFSALDAAWTIRNYNRKIESKVRMSLRNIHQEQTPFVSWQISW